MNIFRWFHREKKPEAITVFTVKKLHDYLIEICPHEDARGRIERCYMEMRASRYTANQMHTALLSTLLRGLQHGRWG